MAAGQGGGAGRVWPAEGRTLSDPDTGVRLRQLTAHRAHSHHFYFHADGTGFLGHCRFDDSDRVESTFPGQTGHIHSNGPELIVGDGGGVLRLWKWTGQGYDGPRLLCRHDSSMKIQQRHPHPRFSRDGTQVLFTSDVTGYGNVYLADVPEFGSLPSIQE